MTTMAPSVDLFERVIDLLTLRWQISSSAAVVALIQVAEDLHLSVSDLAALVYASHDEHGHVDPLRG